MQIKYIFMSSKFAVSLSKIICILRIKNYATMMFTTDAIIIKNNYVLMAKNAISISTLYSITDTLSKKCTSPLVNGGHKKWSQFFLNSFCTVTEMSNYISNGKRM